MPTVSRYDRIQAMREAGYKLHKIAKEFGCSPGGRRDNTSTLSRDGFSLQSAAQKTMARRRVVDSRARPDLARYMAYRSQAQPQAVPSPVTPLPLPRRHPQTHALGREQPRDGLAARRLYGRMQHRHQQHPGPAARHQAVRTGCASAQRSSKLVRMTTIMTL